LLITQAFSDAVAKIDFVAESPKVLASQEIGPMIFARHALVLLLILLLVTTPVWAQIPVRQGLWANMQLGYGSISRSSDQQPRQRQDAFALAYHLGGTLNHHVRLGVELNGWLLEAFDAYDPAKGESVSQVFAVAQVYPYSANNFFLKVGAGRAIYTNSHPFEFDSRGWGETIGVGYDFPIAKKISLTPVINYCRGSLGSVENQVSTVSNRKYSVLEFGIALTYP
jgi:hypothetical protein